MPSCDVAPQCIRRWLLAAATSALMASAPDATAQGSLGGIVGATVPLGGSADQFDIGDQASAFFSFSPPGPFRRARLDFTWVNLQERSLTPRNQRFFWTTLGMILTQPGVSVPTGYVVLGVGSYHQRRTGARRDAAGLNAGAGIDFALGSFGAFAEARVHYLLDDTRTKLFPLGFGLRF